MQTSHTIHIGLLWASTLLFLISVIDAQFMSFAVYTLLASIVFLMMCILDILIHIYCAIVKCGQ